MRYLQVKQSYKYSFTGSLHRYLGICLQLTSFHFTVNNFRWRNVNDFLFIWVFLLNLHHWVFSRMTTKQPPLNLFYNPLELYHSIQWKLSFHTLFTPLHFNYLTFKIKIHTCSSASRSPIHSVWRWFSSRCLFKSIRAFYDWIA